ncbi:MAG: hypothetical protein CL596_11160 [Alteromonas sp.]|nr:hypothetical protein [Alteromonas sp.]MAY21446.1 hypothetical protein [Flavobacteriaceae bacterium]|tara:strand:- start:699 stop:1124 length:426 start_codon:yes stop_codon:yes gene_type:complete
MFSKEESKRLRHKFWISFGKSFPRKWILYNTGLKDISFKFYFDTKKARVSVDIESSNEETRKMYFNKFSSLKAIISEKLPGVIFKEEFLLENEKEVSSIYIEKKDVSIHNKSTWQETMLFLKDTMISFEEIWHQFEDYIKA